MYPCTALIVLSLSIPAIFWSSRKEYIKAAWRISELCPFGDLSASLAIGPVQTAKLRAHMWCTKGAFVGHLSFMTGMNRFQYHSYDQVVRLNRCYQHWVSCRFPDMHPSATLFYPAAADEVLYVSPMQGCPVVPFLTAPDSSSTAMPPSSRTRKLTSRTMDMLQTPAVRGRGPRLA
jgi:hypothetical protein